MLVTAVQSSVLQLWYLLSSPGIGSWQRGWNRVVGVEGKVVFLVCEVGEHQSTGLWGAMGEAAGVKGVSSLRELHNL